MRCLVIVGLDPLDSHLSVHPGDGAHPRPPERYAGGERVTDAGGALRRLGDHFPATIESLDIVGPAELERLDLDNVAELELGQGSARL
jgi:hypothetical protein